MGLLGDADPAVRIEAIKGLGTWEAVEAMPELIGFLKDPKPEVAAAARATLDRLNQER
jgi:HEAT repeat protein